ncbi:MORN repeat-containing protein 1-like isoform X3 [Mizuhopecten yessoensis]|uniref:MORN repeat-containing protein 1-like isoform X3 n=1 Tax=Mizuhopecten yessoensis TaxID=6573 RepID=UPI000B45B6F8|nr:MORN repeat-containing protein 1-like isoform X3 [Mizuhopecten yessoensis]
MPLRHPTLAKMPLMPHFPVSKSLNHKHGHGGLSPENKNGRIRLSPVNKHGRSGNSPENKHKAIKFEKNDDLEYKLPFLPKAVKKDRKPLSERNACTYNSMPKGGSGLGVYTYENKYFRYEGQWRNGKKHGHGKLQMQDGSYYEGTFNDGEINGHGFRYFSTTGCKYTGQFHKGELHGTGKMIYTDGSIYDGQWYRNRKHGYGVMRSSDSAVYEGAYQSNLRHGEGLMLYSSVRNDGVSNGDKYAGQWVNDRRDGEGELTCTDGTVYSGHFIDNLFHGFGLLKHISGYYYNGEWAFGQPVKVATKIVIKIEENPFIIRQGLPFSVKVECQNDEGEVIEEHGRELRLLVGFKYYAPKEGSVLFDMIEDVEDKPIDTPFGYQVVPYPVSDQINTSEGGDGPDDEEKEDELSKSQNQTDIIEDAPEDQGEEEHEEEEKEKGDDGLEKKVEEDEDKTGVAVGTDEEGVAIGGENVPDGAVEEKAEIVEEKESVTLPPPIPNHRCEHGLTDWENLQLAPAPPMYRPFVAMEEAAHGKFSKGKSKSKIEPLTRRPSFNASRMTTLDRYRKQREKERQEKYAKTGEYVLMVHDVTQPPAMDKVLEPAFHLLKLKRPKREPVKKEKGPKWDTSRHIANAGLQRSESITSLGTPSLIQ